MDLKFFLTVFVVGLSLGLVLWFWALPAVFRGAITPVVALGGTLVVVAIAVVIFRGVWSMASGKRAKRE